MQSLGPRCNIGRAGLPKERYLHCRIIGHDYVTFKIDILVVLLSTTLINTYKMYIEEDMDWCDIYFFSNRIRNRGE
jgi:hypothetical protein